MIVPVTNEIAWMNSLRDVPTWTPDCSPILLLAPHPDDETLGAGVLVASLRRGGVEVKVVAVTDGENAYPDEP